MAPAAGLLKAAAPLVACMAYATISVGTSFITKTLFSVYDFKFPFFVLAAQLGVSVIVTTIFRLFPSISPVTMTPFSWDIVKAAIIPSSMFVLNVVVGFVGISRVNLPLFLCLRRTTIVFLLLGEAIILQKFASRTASLCVGVIALGTIVAGWHSLTEGSASDEGLVSYGFVLANNLCTAGYLLKSKELTEKLQVRGLNLVFYQSLIGFPLAAIASVLFGEPEGLSAYVSWSSPAFQLWLCLAACAGTAIVLATIIANTLNSPTTLGVTGAMKDIVATFMSVALFSGFDTNFTNVLGLILSLVGSVGYTANKVMETQKAAAYQRITERRDEEQGMVKHGAISPEDTVLRHRSSSDHGTRE